MLKYLITYIILYFIVLAALRKSSNEFVNKILKKTLTDLKIESISIHGLRHTHASVLLYKKISIYYVSEHLGHAKIDTTLNYYSHVIKELREEDTRNTLDLFEKMPTVKTFV
ncbi:tyrosine-type recombinase/integrase [Bacillus nakamurai]|uniref:tyrosine-type recombinase/integrase n=1 Tax=Bacillus nakamurai TaxID=1793963 RepID=UPI002E1A1383